MRGCALLAFAALLVLAGCRAGAGATPAGATHAAPTLAGPTPAGATPTARAQATAGGTPVPQASATPLDTQTATATPAPRARQLTGAGCCVQPYWSADGSQVRYIDRPSANDPSGIYAVDALAGGAPRFVTDTLGIFSPDGRLVAYPQDGATYILEIATGRRWSVPSGGRAISFSPDGARILWQISSASTGNFDRRSTDVWLADVDGSGARRVVTVIGGGASTWFPDGKRMLATYRDAPGGDPYLAVLDLQDGKLAPIVQAPRLRGSSLSQDGAWVAYTVAFSGDAAQDGLWVVRTDGSQKRRLDVYGAYRWRADQLLLVPLDLATSSDRLLDVDPSTGAVRPLTDPASLPFSIAGGDWSLSPDGKHVAFVSAADHNIWVIDLP